MDIMTIFILLGLGLGLVLYSVMPRRGDKRDALKRRLEGRRVVDEAEEIKQKARQTATESLVRKATPMLSRLIMPVSAEEQTQLRLKLMQAGFRQQQAQTVFLFSKTAVAGLGLVGGVALAMYLNYSIMTSIGIVVTAVGLGFLAPGFWLGSAISDRQTKLRRGLPDILDLLVVSVESGLALDAGIKRVGDEMERVHPELAEEFRISTRETQMGIRRAEALDNLATRTGVDEIRSLVSVIAQAERFGTSVAKALRTQGETLRTKRRQKAEEKAQQTAVKLMIPLVLFIFPAMGVVLAGPAAIRMFEAF
ncbi:MAG: type II secretion system F family protein [Phycisphaerae bacterium]|nr:type II secretion system F family protein [Phycisphaerae bacterium]MCZ2399387.1 type II secretion system F family protein [Phycisphaerae bacterium]NUQ49466.1 type II secretion system F family protein [Phycisphaerae bacterium]